MAKRTSLAVIINNQDVLLGRKDPNAQSLLRNQWQFPGGCARPGESINDTFSRENGEEVIGLNVQPLWLLGYQYLEREHKQDVELYFTLAYAQNRNARPGSDLVELRWAKIQYAPQICSAAAKMWPKSVINFLEQPDLDKIYQQHLHHT